ncbi:MAG: TGS domain-containing protein [Thermoprotei archaeon]
MPANLPAEARAKWAKVLEAKTKEEKIKALQEYLAAVPKHKGTEKIVSQVRHQIAVLKREIEEEKSRRGSGYGFSIEREGDVQVVMVGFTGSGKSALLSRLTGAKVEISNHPYTTTRPVPGVFKHGGVLIQLVEAPAIIKEGGKWNDMVFSLVRNANGVLLVIDGSYNPRDQLNKLLSMFEDYGLLLGDEKCKIEIKRGPYPHVQVIVHGRLMDATIDDVRRLLNDYRITNAQVTIWGEATLDDVERFITGNVMYKPAIVLVNKVDMIKDNVELYTQLPILYVSAVNGTGLNLLGDLLIKTLKLIRVYTKEPNETKHSSRPLVLKEGSTVKDVAERIHKTFTQRLKYAKVWGKSAKYPGEKVGEDHVLLDGDIIELKID